MKLVIEGMDGVGKSTVANAISKRFNMKYIDGLMNTYFKDEGFSEHELDIIHKAVGKFYGYDNSIIRTWIMGFANLFNLVNYGENVVIDRHCLTTYFYNADEKSREIYKEMQKLVGKPDLVIILEAKPETRICRIKSRNNMDPDLNEEVKLLYGYDKFEEAAEYLELKYKVVHTDNKTLKQVIEEVENIIELELKGGKIE